MAAFKAYPFLLGFIVLFCFVRPTVAFGAGNIAGISSIEGQNWRHGDIEDALLKLFMARAVGGKRFDKLMVSRVYFGNWLRDYSQAIDVGTVKSVSAEAIRLLLCVLGFLTFGYGSREFEVTAERLGTYRPEDHIDNPKNYADNQDARRYDPRLRGPVNESVELAIDPQSGMKNYIANERAGIMTSALHVRRLFTKCIQLGRGYGRSHSKDDLYEALRLMGTGLHCLEDFFAHSNYTELALIELGERNIFPHVGRNTMLRIPGAQHPVYPVVTGTFGGVDFLHSVTGELSDKMTQNEIGDLEGTLKQSSRQDTSLLHDLLDKIPDGLLGGGDKKSKVNDLQANAQAAQMENMSISPRDPEEFTIYVKNAFNQVMPAIRFHDEVFMSISEAIERIPVLPQLIEQLEDQMSVFVFSVIAPFIVPLIEQIKNELAAGSSEIINSSKNEQLIVFEDDRSTDPTHSMLSKDHFTNILNEIAGRTASRVVSWVVPQLMQAWDDHSLDVDSLLNKIIYGVMHHPAQRDMGPEGAREGRALIFASVKEWWGDMGDAQRNAYRRQLSRDGVERGENHKEGGPRDCGHGCGGKLTMRKKFANDAPQTAQDRIAGVAAEAIMGGVKNTFSSGVGEVEGGFGGGGGRAGHGGGRQESSDLLGGMISSFTGGGSGGGGQESNLLGGLISGVAGGFLGGGFKREETDTFRSEGRTPGGGYTETTTEYGHHGDRYAQAEYTQTQYPGGRGGASEYQRFEQQEDGSGRGGASYAYTQRTETQYGGGSGGFGRREEETTTTTYGGNGGGYGRHEEETGYGRRGEQTYGGGGEQNYGGHGRRVEEKGFGDMEEDGGYGQREERPEHHGGHHGGHHGDRHGGHHGGQHGGHHGDQGRREEGEGYGGYGGRQEEETGYGRREEGGYGEQRHGRQEQERGYGRRQRNDEEEEAKEEGRERRGWGY